MNKTLLLLLGADVFGLALVAGIVRKIQPVSLSSLVNHCQSLTSSLILHLPHLFWPVLVATFLIILLATLIRTLGSLIHIYRLTVNLSANSKLQRRFEAMVGKLDLEGRAVLVENDRAFAFCAGIFSPKIFVSTALSKVCNERELEAILWHERHHLESRDTLTMFVAYISQSLFPFFPILSDFIASYKAAREIDADRQCVQGLKTNKPLIGILSKILALKTLEVVFVPAMTNMDGLERRIRSLVGINYPGHQYKARNIILSLVAILSLLGIIFSPVEAIELHARNQDVTLVCVNHPSASSQNYSLPASRVNNQFPLDSN